MLQTAPGTTSASRGERIDRELDHARREGPLREIVIPPCPERLARLQRAVAAAEPDLAEVGRIAAGDVAMAAVLIRNANGARFAGGQPVQTVGQAMNRVGLRTTAALMTNFLVRHALPVKHPQLRRFWERATLRAVALAFVARRLPGMSVDLAYTFGLFSHVGMPVLLQCVRGYGGTLAEAAARIDRPFVETENANHRTDHTVVGAMVARAWGLAPAVVRAIRLHHELSSLRASDVDNEVQTLMAAGALAEHVTRQREGLDPESDWLQHGEAALRWLGLSGDDLADWDPALQATLDAA